MGVLIEPCKKWDCRSAADFYKAKANIAFLTPATLIVIPAYLIVYALLQVFLWR